MIKKMTYFFVAIFIVGIVAAYMLYKTVFGNYIEQDLMFTIPSNSTYSEVLESLKSKEIIKNESIFNNLAQKMNYPNKVYSGKYQFNKGESLYDLIVKLRGAHQTPVNLTINNVNFKEDLAGKISQQLEIDSATIQHFLNDSAVLDSLGYNTDNIMTMFIPNTYEMYWNTSFLAFINKMEEEHNRFWNTERKNKCISLGISPTEAFIIASIVEKEYKYADERKRIAGVYLNRIEKGMKLQADPTVKFAIGDLSIKRVLTVHTEYDNPYNTYFYSGTPPGPICLPETSTIDAVLNAENHNYIYFCAKADLSGYHTFNSTYSAHLNAAKLYHAALNKMKIYE